MRNDALLTPGKAVLFGHLVVTLPVFAIIGLTTLTIYLVVGPPPGVFSLFVIDVGVLVGAAVGWLWWSASVPRWREWAKRNGADEDRTQLLAQRTLLVWPRGSFFEKTEFRIRKRS
jgi:hypothetical protein